MADTRRTFTELLAIFADAQPAGSITAQDMRDMLVTLKPAHGFLYMQGNTTATTFTGTSTYEKILGATTQGSHSHYTDMPDNNRLRYTDTIDVTALVNATLAVTCGTNNQVFEASVYKNGVLVPGSVTEGKCLAVGDPTFVALMAEVTMSANDYVELYIANESSTAALTVSYMQMQLNGEGE